MAKETIKQQKNKNTLQMLITNQRPRQLHLILPSVINGCEATSGRIYSVKYSHLICVNHELGLQKGTPTSLRAGTYKSCTGNGHLLDVCLCTEK